MRQVPASSAHPSGHYSEQLTPQSASLHYLVVGDGRLARHLSQYLSLENLPFTQWSRSGSAESESQPSFAQALAPATHVLLAISDRAIESFIRENQLDQPASLGNRALVHFSGALASSLAPSAHPLMTFGPDLYPIDIYRSIPFVCEKPLAELMPGLSNSSYLLDPTKKALYHAACSLGGNFTVLLWQKVFSIFESELGLPRTVLYPYLAQTASNLMSGRDALTGPLARGDFATIEKHLQALGSDPYGGVYRAFVTAFSSSLKEAST